MDNNIDELAEQIEASNEDLRHKTDQLSEQFDNIISDAEKTLPADLAELEITNQEALIANERDAAKTGAMADFELDVALDEETEKAA